MWISNQTKMWEHAGVCCVQQRIDGTPNFIEWHYKLYRHRLLSNHDKRLKPTENRNFCPVILTSGFLEEKTGKRLKW